MIRLVDSHIPAAPQVLFSHRTGSSLSRLPDVSGDPVVRSSRVRALWTAVAALQPRVA
jgi:hypothetical protein